MQLVWKLLFYAVAIAATSQICGARNFLRDDNDALYNQRNEDDIASVESPNELWDLREYFNEGKRQQEEEGYREQQEADAPLISCSASQLQAKINQAKRENRYFYIGYTSKGASSRYLKKTGPKSKAWKHRFRKAKTYYANIAGSGVTEKKLVDKNKRDPRCVNGPTAATKSTGTGIVYVVFGQKRGDEDFFSDATGSKNDIRSRSNRVRDVLDKIEYLLRLNRFE